VILESMKMEMPIEAEDDGTVAEILVEEGQSVQEGDSSSSWIVGSVVVDSPADGVARLTISNPRSATRSTAAILDGWSERCRGSTRAASSSPARGRLLGGLRHRRPRAGRLAEEAAELLDAPVRGGAGGAGRGPVPVVAALGGHAFGGGLELAWRATCACARRARGWDAAGAARRRVLAHRAAALRRRDRLRPHARAVPDGAAGERGEALRGAGQRGHVGRGGAASRWPARSRACPRCRCAGPSACCAALIPTAGRRAGGRAARAAATPCVPPPRLRHPGVRAFSEKRASGCTGR
jgi:hypothetical protein